MHFFFDESGDYAFRQDTLDYYVQAVVICPDSQIARFDRYVRELNERLGTTELHAVDLPREQLLEICEFLAASPCELLANVTDSEVVTRAGILSLRLEQAWIFRRNFDRYRILGGNSLAWERQFSRQIKKAGLASQIPDGDYLQAHYLVILIADALAKSVVSFAADEWRDDFVQMRFFVDCKLPGKLSAGEKYLAAILVPALGSRGPRGALRVPPRWREEPVHPFIARYAREHGRIRGRDVRGVISLDAIFEHGLTFTGSHQVAGLQLADVVASVVRSAIQHPADELAQATYDVLRPKLLRRDGRFLDVRGVAANVPVPQERYRHFVRGVPDPTPNVTS